LKDELPPLANYASGDDAVAGMDARQATELVVKLDGWTKRFVALVNDVEI